MLIENVEFLVFRLSLYRSFFSYLNSPKFWYDIGGLGLGVDYYGFGLVNKVSNYTVSLCCKFENSNFFKKMNKT